MLVCISVLSLILAPPPSPGLCDLSTLLSLVCLSSFFLLSFPFVTSLSFSLLSLLLISFFGLFSLHIVTVFLSILFHLKKFSFFKIFFRNFLSLCVYTFGVLIFSSLLSFLSPLPLFSPLPSPLPIFVSFAPFFQTSFSSFFPL